MKKLLFITTRLFWPTDSGRKVSLYYYCKGLHEIYEYDIYLYSFLEAGQTGEMIDSKPDFIKEVRLAAPIGKVKKLTNLLTKSLFSGWPFQNSIYFSGKNKKHISQYCEEICPDLIFVDMIRLAPYYKAFKKCNCLKVLDLDDLLSNRYFKQAQRKIIMGSLMGANSAKREVKAHNSFIKRIVLKSESKRTRKAEIKYGKIYDKVVFVSGKETEEFNKRIKADKAITVTLGTDYDYFSGGAIIDKEKNSLAFFGNMKVAANVDSLKLIVDNILPELNFDYKLYVIGACPDEVREQFRHPRIQFCGRVEDVRPIIKKCEVFLSPIAYGSGIKTKILEAMAMGVPVVTNSIGAEGIDGENGKHFLVSDNYKEISDYVKKLMDDSEFAKKIVTDAQTVVKNKYTWNEIYKSFLQLGI